MPTSLDPQHPLSALRRTLGAAGLALALFGCASPARVEPAWPEQPAPAYPEPAGPRSAAPAEAPPPRELPPSPSSSLAKEYGDHATLDSFEGKATYYADSLAGNRTASGEVYDPSVHSAAHKKLPFGTILRVTRTDTKTSTYVKVNDRGPFGPADRVIDLSKAAAQELDMMKAGVVPVRVEILHRPEKKK